MLEALDVHDGMRVLEIGTGTGYNAALLSHRLGDANVCSVDLDPGLVADARAALDRVGLHPFLAVGNGYHGLSSGAPYDRIVCTAASDDISPEWIDQLKTGGLIVTDLRGDIGGAVAIVTKTSDGVAEGRFATFEAAFMPLRAEVDHPLRAGNTPPDPVDRRNPWRTTTTLAPDCVVDDRAFRFFLQLHLAGTSMSPFTREGGAIVGIGRDSTWVEVDTTPRPDGEHQVAEGGPRRTWHTVEAAHALWRRLGRPPVDRFGISANGGYSRVWFDDPDGPYSWPMPL